MKPILIIVVVVVLTFAVIPPAIAQKNSIDTQIRIKQFFQDGALGCNYACMEALESFFGGKRTQYDFANGNNQGITTNDLISAYQNAGFDLTSIGLSEQIIANHLSNNTPILIILDLGYIIDDIGNRFRAHHAVLVKRIRIYADNTFKITIMNPISGGQTLITKWRQVVNVYAVSLRHLKNAK